MWRWVLPIVWLLTGAKWADALIMPLPSRRRRYYVDRKRRDDQTCLHARLVSTSAFLPMVIGARLASRKKILTAKLDKTNVFANDEKCDDDAFTGDSLPKEEAAKEEEKKEPKTELSLLRDQNRSLRLVVHTLTQELEKLRDRESKYDDLFNRCLTAEANATRLAAEVSRTERLRKRAASEVNHLRGRTRDVLARNAELEATAVVRRQTPENNGVLTPEERALRIHSKRKGEQRPNVVITPSSRKLLSLRFPSEEEEEEEDGAGLHEDDDDDYASSSSSDPTTTNNVPQLIKDTRAPRKAVLVPEFAHQRVSLTRRTVAAPDQELLASKLSRGSTIYQQLQSELARHLVERKYGGTSASSVSLYNVTKAAAKQEILEKLTQQKMSPPPVDDGPRPPAEAHPSSERQDVMERTFVDLYGDLNPADADDDDQDEGTILAKLKKGSTLYQHIREQQVKAQRDQPPPPKPAEVPPPPPPARPASLSELFADDFALTASASVPAKTNKRKTPFCTK